MDAMAALITPDFHDSKWTDQEVGWALVREFTYYPCDVVLIHMDFWVKCKVFKA